MATDNDKWNRDQQRVRRKVAAARKQNAAKYDAIEKQKERSRQIRDKRLQGQRNLKQIGKYGVEAFTAAHGYDPSDASKRRQIIKSLSSTPESESTTGVMNANLNKPIDIQSPDFNRQSVSDGQVVRNGQKYYRYDSTIDDFVSVLYNTKDRTWEPIVDAKSMRDMLLSGQKSSTQQQRREEEISQKLAKVDELESEGQIRPAEAEDVRSQLRSQLFNVKNRPDQYSDDSNEIEYPEGQGVHEVWAEQNSNLILTRDEDGMIHKVGERKNVITPRDINDMYTQVRDSLVTFDDDGNEKPPSADDIKKEMQNRLNIMKDMLSSDNNASQNSQPEIPTDDTPEANPPGAVKIIRNKQTAEMYYEQVDGRIFDENGYQVSLHVYQQIKGSK